jgi:hypothetical protein
VAVAEVAVVAVVLVVDTPKRGYEPQNLEH